MLTVTGRVVLAYTIVFALALGSFASAVYQEGRRAAVAELDLRLDGAAEVATDAIERLEAEGRPAGTAYREAARMSRAAGMSFRVVDQSGRLLAGDSAFVGAPGEGWREAARGRTYRGFERWGKVQARVLWAPLDGRNAHAQAVEVVALPLEMEKDLNRLRLLFLLGIPSLLLLTGLCAYAITHVSFAPVREMIRTARVVSAETLELRLPVPRPKDEIRDLAQTLNVMIDRLNRSFSSQNQFVSDAAHEIRTPLTVIRGELELAQRVGPVEAQKCLGIVRAELERLSWLADGLLSLARHDASDVAAPLNELRLDELVVECVRDMNRTALASGVSLGVHVEEAVEWAGDADQLRSLVMNLIDNAIRYSPQNAAVHVHLSRMAGGEPQLSVKDQGPGMSAADQERAFERFFRSDWARANTSGSGLGLAIARQVAQRHGATIRIVSAPGEGCLFTVAFHAACPPAKKL